MTGRWVGLPVAAVVAVAAVIGVQLAQGGGTYEPLKPPSPCQERPVEAQSDGIEGLTESLVFIGLDEAACDLGVSREELTLQLAQSSPTDAEADALRDGLLAAVNRMASDGTLPPLSDLLDEALANADLNPFVERAIGLLPDRVVDAALPTDDVLTRTVEGLDVREILASLDDTSDLNAAVQTAVTEAIKDTLVDRARELIP